MTTKIQEKPTDTAAHWATQLGADLAARRAEREAERQAAEEAAAGRRQFSAEELQRRFASVAECVLTAATAFEEAAGIEIDAGPAAAWQIQLRAGDVQMCLTREDAVVRVRTHGRSRADERVVALDEEEFMAEPAAQRIAEEFFTEIEANTRFEEERHHVHAH